MMPPDAGAPPAPTASTPPPVATAAPAAGPCDPVQTLAMTTMFQGRAAAEAPGMQPDGAPVCGLAADGQTVSSQTFLMQPGHCYTVLAQAMPTVTEVDVQVEPDLTGGGAANPALAALLRGPALMIGTGAGVMDAAGAKQTCFQWALPFPLAVKMVVKSRGGAGPIAAQAYSKKK